MRYAVFIAPARRFAYTLTMASPASLASLARLVFIAFARLPIVYMLSSCLFELSRTCLIPSFASCPIVYMLPVHIAPLVYAIFPYSAMYFAVWRYATF